MSANGTDNATERSPLLGKPAKAAATVDPEEDNESTNHVGAAAPQADGEDPAIVEGRKKVKSLLPVLGVGIFLAFLDQSVVAAINGQMGSELHSLRNVSWIATSYFLTMTASQPLYGKLSDVFGRKPCLIFAYTAFGIGSLGCGLTRTMEGLIASRAIQGIGGGGMLILVTVLLSDFIPLRDRGTYQGYLNLLGAIGSTSGGPLGGLFVQSIGWRWVFLIQVALCVAAIIVLGLLLNLPQKQSDSVAWRQLRRIDFLGAILLILTVTSLLFGLNQGSNTSWQSAPTIATLCATVPLLLAFLAVENRVAIEPFAPGHVIFDKALFAVYGSNFFLYAAFTPLIFYLPLLFQVKFEMTPAQAGASLIPAAISAVVGTLSGGLILKRIGKFYWLAVISAAIATLGAIPLVVAPSLSRGSLASIYVASVATFVPQGITLTASLIAIISNVSAADQAVATACSFLFRSLGAAVGVSLVGVLIQDIFRIRLRDAIEPEIANHILQEIAQSLEYIENLSPSLRAVVRDCYATGFQAGFGMCVGFLALSTLSTFWWREKRLS